MEGGKRCDENVKMKETNLFEIQTKAMEHAKRKLTESVMQKATEIMYLQKKKNTDRKRREKHSVKPRNLACLAVLWLLIKESPQM